MISSELSTAAFRLALTLGVAGLPQKHALAQSSRDRVLEYCVVTQGQSCYDEGILKRGEPIPVPIPRYDVDGQCRRFNANPRVCIEAEQDDYEAARRVWPHLSEKSQRDCASSFRTEGERRYASFKGCVYFRTQEEYYAARRLPDAEFPVLTTRWGRWRHSFG